VYSGSKSKMQDRAKQAGSAIVNRADSGMKFYESTNVDKVKFKEVK